MTQLIAVVMILVFAGSFTCFSYSSMGWRSVRNNDRRYSVAWWMTSVGVVCTMTAVMVFAMTLRAALGLPPHP
jgi:hypothetical protein